ncbi:MAG: hypothetical protein AB7O57_16420 [Hyphomicrobiaceae bacterium]
MGFLSKPTSALVAGLAASGLALAVWMSESQGDGLGLASFLARLVHIAAAMIWVGMIWFVNYVQLAALGEADEPGRAVLRRLVVPRVAKAFRIASHVAVASGVALLLTTGYMLDRWVFPSAVYIPAARAALIWSGTIAGLAMWALAHFLVWPALKVVLDGASSPGEAAHARRRALFGARLNLALSMPVTFAMVAAAHLY